MGSVDRQRCGCGASDLTCNTGTTVAAESLAVLNVAASSRTPTPGTAATCATCTDLAAPFASESRKELVAIIRTLLAHDRHVAALLHRWRDAELHRRRSLSDAAGSV